MQALYPEQDLALGREEAIQAPVTVAEKVQAEKSIRKMKRSLKEWLKFRTRRDEVATGAIKAKVPASIVKQRIVKGRDWALEQRLALELHTLLSEVMDASQLPNPDITKDPNAAVKLAKIAISGQTPGEAAAPSAQGILPVVFIWPIVIVVGMVMFTIMSKISSDADVAKEKERIECIKEGACTDSGFWLKMGGIAVVAWIVWDKFGLKEGFKKR